MINTGYSSWRHLLNLKTTNAIQRELSKDETPQSRRVKQAVYRADIDKKSGWRLHLQFDRESNQLHLKDIIPGQGHDDAVDVIKAKKDRYE